MSDEPMSDQLQAELEDWQAPGLDSLSLFPYWETLDSLTGRQ
jgi:hypothetical protein